MFFIVILNLGNVIPDESVELVPKFTLRRATSGEVELIKPLLASHMTIGDLAELFEKQKVVMVDSEKEYQAILEPLPLDRHRYFVIACQEKSDDLKPNLAAIRVAAMLSSSGLILGPTIETKASGILTGWDSVSLFNYFYGISPLGKTNIFVNFDTAKLMEFCSIYELWTKHDNDAFDLLSRINEFQGLRRLERNSKFLVLGCFSIIESIITHKPDPKDPYESLTRQICRKMILLSKRFNEPFDYSKFKEPDAIKIWKMLYHYRSIIAHGDTADFKKDKDLRPLQGQDVVLTFLHTTTRLLLLQALKEPVLIKDLREC